MRSLNIGMSERRHVDPSERPEAWPHSDKEITVIGAFGATDGEQSESGAAREKEQDCRNLRVATAA
jgi:hypothetical protein